MCRHRQRHGGRQMAEYRSIEIDFDVHKRIEIARRSFKETDNEVLRRLLEIETKAAPVSLARARIEQPWSGKGVTLPHGTQVRMKYRGRVYVGMIDNGAWL